MQIEVCPAFRWRRRIVTQPGLAEGRGIPVLHKARMLTAKISQGLGLYTLGLHAVCGAPELVPLLPNNVMTQQVTAVHRNIPKLVAAPDTYLFQQVVNAK